MNKSAVDRSHAWSAPWHELQRELALGFLLEPARSCQAPQAVPQAHAGSSWLRRSRARGAG
ncbi:MAG TPA: hypothetical protein VHV81_01020 [Steroidobacteraceae bacterium]|nr:hypothetical protein [Steroidobacteraceae bacterium]